ncbi:hypothetical protein FN846DRAFT_910894 [Sphaerosporella brunnea]|uniref:Uncharacterized protein n=1 Tax=Sphaerosporella brunnea TaxID=1250544 RepID=A0A5J5ENC3_9PEZI|nr:hypothetical protein FN846DRAFT_910894 [Sphaerosporella brunnea]
MSCASPPRHISPRGFNHLCRVHQTAGCNPHGGGGDGDVADDDDDEDVNVERHGLCDDEAEGQAEESEEGDDEEQQGTPCTRPSSMMQRKAIVASNSMNSAKEHGDFSLIPPHKLEQKFHVLLVTFLWARVLTVAYNALSLNYWYRDVFAGLRVVAAPSDLYRFGMQMWATGMRSQKHHDNQELRPMLSDQLLELPEELKADKTADDQRPNREANSLRAGLEISENDDDAGGVSAHGGHDIDDDDDGEIVSPAPPTPATELRRHGRGAGLLRPDPRAELHRPDREAGFPRPHVGDRMPRPDRGDGLLSPISDWWVFQRSVASQNGFKMLLNGDRRRNQVKAAASSDEVCPLHLKPEISREAQQPASSTVGNRPNAEHMRGDMGLPGTFPQLIKNRINFRRVNMTPVRYVVGCKWRGDVKKPVYILKTCQVLVVADFMLRVFGVVLPVV